MKTINDIINMIDLQEEVKPLVLSAYKKLNLDDYNEYIKDLLAPKTSLEARERLKDALHPDEGNMKILAIMLYALTFTYQKYQEKGISDEIFIATIKCYKRFLNEHRVGYNKWFFDRDWWTYKQVAMVIFRIGELEYEMKELNGEKFISMHIPSDANIKLDLVKASIKAAKNFFKTNFPDYSDVEYRCNTWLLSPDLKELLPPSSKIIQFQSLFEIIGEKQQNSGLIAWVFKKHYDDYTKLPEDTSLQRNMKKYLLAGNNVSIALGLLKR